MTKLPGDPTTEIVKELVGQLPVKEAYRDALSPGMKQTGGLVEDLTKTVRLALFPFQIAAAYQDKFASFLKRSVAEVAEPQRIPPPNQILGPVLEGIRYENDGSLLWEMFSHLLSNSMDEKSAQLAHPAFPALIRQLAPDEALMLKAMSKGPNGAGEITAKLKTDVEKVLTINDLRLVDADANPVKLQFHESLELYLFHLNALNLIQQTADSVELNAEPKSVFKLSPLGQHFMRAVTRSKEA
jgi:hypothetical protein